MARPRMQGKGQDLELDLPELPVMRNLVRWRTEEVEMMSRHSQSLESLPRSCRPSTAETMTSARKLSVSFGTWRVQTRRSVQAHRF